MTTSESTAPAAAATEKTTRAGSRRSDEGGGGGRRPARLAPNVDIDLNDVETLRQFVTDHGKILPARIAGLTARQQRQVKRGIKRCRVMGLLP